MQNIFNYYFLYLIQLQQLSFSYGLYLIAFPDSIDLAADQHTGVEQPPTKLD